MYMVFVYDKGLQEVASKKFTTLNDAFLYVGELDLKTKFHRVILDDFVNGKILINLVRDSDGNLTSK